MSWKLGVSKSKLKDSESGRLLSLHSEKDGKENGGISSRSSTPIPSRPTTPRPPGEPATFRQGVLTVVVFQGKCEVVQL